MLTPHQFPAEPAYERLTRRDARRGLRLVCGIAAAASVASLVIYLVLGADPVSAGFLALIAGMYGACWVLLARVPARWLDTLAGIMGCAAIVSCVGSVSTFPLLAPTGTVGFIGVFPIAVPLFALWSMRSHLIWLLAGTLVLAGMILVARPSAALAVSIPPLIMGWILGGAVSIVGQQALERGRRASLASMARAHAGRRRGATELRRLRAVEAIGRALAQHGPTDQTLDAAMHVLRDEFGYAFPSIYLGDDQVVRLGAQLGYDTPIMMFPRDRGVIGRVMRTRKPVLLPSVETSPDFVRASDEVHSEIVVPLLAEDRFLGVLNVESRFALGPDDLASVSIIADRLAAALALADRRDALETVLAAAPLAIVTYTIEDHVGYWNPAATALFGWEPDEVLGGPAPIYDPEDAAARALSATLLAGGRVLGVETTRRHRDGHWVPVRISASPMGDLGSYAAIYLYEDLTAERAASEALVESETRFETVVGALGEGVVVQSLDQSIRYMNPAAARILGQRQDQLEGRAPFDPGWAAIHEDGRPLSAEEYPASRVMATGAAVSGLTVGIRHPDGRVTWTEAGAVPLVRSPGEPPEAIVTSLTDITQRKRHEDELRLAERRVGSVLEQASNPIIGVDRGGVITFANARVTELFGYAPDELVGAGMELLVPDVDVEAHREHRQGYLARPVPRPMGIGMELLARHRDGTLLPVEIALNPVETPAGLEIYATIVDTTERRRIEAELLQAAKMDSIGRLAGGIAHDFNNLLTAIIGYGRLATDTLEPDAPARADVDQVLLAAERAADLTRQLLGFARKAELSPGTHDLNAIVADLEPLLRRLLGERIALVTNLSPATGSIRVDRSQVDQVLVNLAANARDAMPDGGSLVIETAALDADAVDGTLGVRGDRVAMLTVSDTGVGMSEAVRARVFEPFYTTKPFGEGTGLGLATTYGIVRQSGGAVVVDSAPGAGTTFRIFFPQVPPVDAAAAPAPGPAPARFAGRTVLVVEDEESVRLLVARMLERLGCRVLQAPNGAAAVSLVGTRLGEIDLLLSDIVMPGMRGPELADALRSVRPDLPVAFMSGYAAGEAGIPDGVPLLGKPFTPDEIARVLAAVLEPMPAAG